MSDNSFDDMESAILLRDIIRRNKTITTLGLAGNKFGQTTGAVKCIADGLGSNSTLLKISLSNCLLRDDGVSILTQTLGSRNKTLQKLSFAFNFISSTGVGVLLKTMEQSSHHITDLGLCHNSIGDEGASLHARSLGKNAIPNLTHISLSGCDIGDDGFTALVSALEQNTALLQLVLLYQNDVSERGILALAKSLPEIKVLQRLDLSGRNIFLASTMPLLLEGLRYNTSLFRFHIAGCASISVPPTTQETARCASVQEMEHVGHRNRFLSLIRAPRERLPPRGIWPRVLAQVATLHDVIFEVLRSKPKLVPSKDTGRGSGVPKKRKHGNE